MEWVKDTVLIGPSERYNLELDATNPGVWMVHCHIEHHMANGMMTVIQYEGHVPTGPAAASFDEVFGDHAGIGHGEHGSGDSHGSGALPTLTPTTASANVRSRSRPHYIQPPLRV